MRPLSLVAGLCLLLFFCVFFVAGVRAQGGTPTPAPQVTPVPTPTLTLDKKCLANLMGEDCRKGIAEEFPLPWAIAIIVGIVVISAVGAGLLVRLKDAGQALPDWLPQLWRGRDTTSRYLKLFIADFSDPKYQPFTGDDVRKPKLEKIYLSLDLRPEASGDIEGDAATDKLSPTRLMRMGGESRVQLPMAIRSARKHLALIGGAGCGKSTFLQWAGLACARDCARQHFNDDLQRELVYALSQTTVHPLLFRFLRFLHLTQPLFPVFIPLGEFDQYCLHPHDPQQPEKKLDGTLPPNAESLLKFACWRVNQRHAGLKHFFTPQYLTSRLREGALLLFDGMDEVRFERRDGVRHAVQDLLREAALSKRSRVLLTSRPPGYTREAWSDDFLKCDVLPMTSNQRNTLIYQLFRAIYSDRDKTDAKTRTLIDSLDQSDERVQTMAQTPLLATIFAKLQHNAYRLPDQRARVYKEAIDLILDEVYRKEERTLSVSEASDSGQRLTWLSRIAFELQQAAVGEAGLIREDLLTRVCADAKPSEVPALKDKLRSFLHTMAKNACLIEETQENYYGFRSHRSFQEFLAGRYLAQEYAPYDLDKLIEFIRQVARSDNRDQWEEPLRLAVGFLAIDAEARVEQFLDRLHALGRDLEFDRDAHDWHQAVTALALFDLPAKRAAALGTLRQQIVDSAFAVFVRPTSPLRDSLVADLGLALAQTNDARMAQPLLEKFIANPPVIRRLAQRRAIGLALGALGDPRFTPTLAAAASFAVQSAVHDVGLQIPREQKIILPTFITIPAGDFRMGTSDDEAELLKAQDAEPWKDERPQHTVYVSEFAIGKYPVTNAEFRCFVTDAKGYDHEKFWGDEGWRWRTDQLKEADLSYISDKDIREAYVHWLKGRPKAKRHQPFFWDDPQWNAPNLPVVGVTWYEAEAYCNWLSEVTGQPIRLPTEAEWEKAARYKDLAGLGDPRGLHMLWPWGDTWDKDKCNSSESGFNSTTPVGLYPNGASPLGVADMVGNVWEWCLDGYNADLYKQREAAGQEVHDPKEPLTNALRALRVLRGGSWNDQLRNCRSARRLGNDATNFSKNVGLRVVRSPIRF